MKFAGTALVGALLLTAAPDAGEARVVRFVVEQTRPFAGGAAFGSAGPYVRLEGTAYLEVDPADPLNALIVNLDKAPRNARGRVEFSTRFVIIKPVDMATRQPEDPLRHQQPREQHRAALPSVPRSAPTRAGGSATA